MGVAIGSGLRPWIQAIPLRWGHQLLGSPIDRLATPFVEGEI